MFIYNYTHLLGRQAFKNLKDSLEIHSWKFKMRLYIRKNHSESICPYILKCRKVNENIILHFNVVMTIPFNDEGYIPKL